MPEPRKRGGVRKAAGATTEALRKKARAHADAALAALAEIAETGSSEATRVAAANALLDRGFGKAGAAPADASADTPPPVTAVKWID